MLGITSLSLTCTNHWKLWENKWKEKTKSLQNTMNFESLKNHMHCSICILEAKSSPFLPSQLCQKLGQNS